VESAAGNCASPPNKAGRVFCGPALLGDQAAAEADGDRMGPRAGLELCQQMADVGLHGLLGEIEPLADLPVDESVGDELEHLELAPRRLLLEFLERAGEGNHLGAVVPALLRNRLEAARMVAVTVQDLVALGSVHDWAIGRTASPL
jgi:hypothetical protein